eukprot:TRINITY_DN29429_c0_g1_i1.p1 TRINITY_DN29429_c0_g1~~TRINITY_DN29429_c0_g1_i1.p1  ORF type:complete len:268 (+),score=-24.32 TRINITY_DN29429_c0_g1_i1:37-804(+)
MEEILKEFGDINTVEKRVQEALALATEKPPPPLSLASLPMPTTQVAEQTTRHAREWLEEELFQHSLRTYFLGAAVATGIQLGHDWDAELAYVASAMHDIGLCERAALQRSPLSFELHGGILAREFLLNECGASPAFADGVAEAICRHRDVITAGYRDVITEGTASGHSPEGALVIFGSHLDVYGGGDLARLICAETVREVGDFYPRKGFAEHFKQCFLREVKLKRFSSAAGYITDGAFMHAVAHNPLFSFDGPRP